jgi:hypothetical protein
VDLWRLLSKLSKSRRHQIESLLATKLEYWRGLDQQARPTYKAFAKAVMQDAFSSRWSEFLQREDRDQLLSAADNGLLMEAFQLFEHVLREPTDNE